MAKCDTCKHKTTEDGWMVCDCCIHEQSMGDRYKPFTHADRIRAMTDEELAEFFWQMENGQIPLAVAYCKGVERCPAPDSIDLADCKKCLLEKLQQPCEDSPTVEKG